MERLARLERSCVTTTGPAARKIRNQGPVQWAQFLPNYPPANCRHAAALLEPTAVDIIYV